MPEPTPHTPEPDTLPADAPQEDADAQPTLSPEDMRREIDKLRKENAKARVKAKQFEEKQAAEAEAKRQAELTAEERAVAAEKRATEALAAAEARVLTAERKAALAGKVQNPERVMRLMDDPETYFDAGVPDVDLILRDFPEYAPAAQGPGAIRAPGAPRHTGKSDVPKPEDFKGKGLDWAIRNIDKLQPPPR